MKHPRDVLHQEIALVDSRLDRPATVYLIGGGAMSFQDLKDATKDIDGILESPEDLAVLARALERADYALQTELDHEYEDLGATRIYAKDGAPQWDLFIQVVCRKLRLSPGMRERSQRFEASGKRLELRLIAPEDIFVFKAITERKTDVPDVRVLWASGLDWSVILDEMRWQCRNSDRAWAGYFLATLQQLQDEGRRVPILADVERLAQEELDEWAVLNVLKEPRTPDEVVEALQEDEDEDVRDPVFAALERLIADGRLVRDGAQVRRNRSWMAGKV